MKYGLVGVIGIFEIIYWVGYGQWLTGQFSTQIEILVIVGGIIPIVLIFLGFCRFDKPNLEPKQPNPTTVNDKKD